MNDTFPSFEQAAERFVQFLRVQGWPAAIRWVRPGDLRYRGGVLSARARREEAGERRARAVYARALELRRGVGIESLCRLGQLTFARVVRPRTKDAAERLLFGDGLKLTVLAGKSERRVIVVGWAWPVWAAIGTRWPPADDDIEA